MKKKLVVLFVLGYMGGSFSEEPSSPFGPNPFAPSAEASPENNSKSTVPAEANPFASSAPSHLPENPFGAPSFENPFAVHEAPSASHEQLFTHSVESRVHSAVPYHEEGNHKNATDEQHQTQQQYHKESAFVKHDDTPPSEVVVEKNPDTGEDAAIDSEVDTFEQEGSGNWLLKRVWWEKTEGVYEQIKQVFNEIMSARMDYISQRNRLDRELDISYGQIGLEEGELQDIIEYCLDFVKKEKPEQGFLSKQQEDLYNALQNKQHDLEQIKLDLKALQAVDQKIDEALDTLFKQIDVANQYEQKAWDNFKDIARELNDKIARKSYYETEGLLKDIQTVHSYITSQFSSYFNQTLQTARTHSQSISSQIQALKQAGVDLKKEAGALEQAQEAERLKKELSEHDKEREAAEKKKEAKTTVKPVGMVSGFIGSVKLLALNVVDHILHAATSCASWIKGWFIKEESVVKAREKALKLKVENEKKKAEVVLSKEEARVEQEVDKEEDVVQQEADALQKSVRQEEAAFSTQAREDSTPEIDDNPFRQEEVAKSKGLVTPIMAEKNSFNERRVSVMPQEQLSDSVKTFGHPPTEELSNHPAFSHNPPVHNETVNQGTHPVSPFAK